MIMDALALVNRYMKELNMKAEFTGLEIRRERNLVKKSPWICRKYFKF